MQKRVLAGLPILAASLIFLGLWIAEKIAVPSVEIGIKPIHCFQSKSSRSPNYYPADNSGKPTLEISHRNERRIIQRLLLFPVDLLL